MVSSGVFGARIGRTVAHAPRLNHFENPDDLREIDQLRDNRRALASSPAQVLSGLQIGVQAVGTVALLAWIYPPVLAVPVLAVLPWLAGRRAAKLQQRADDDLAEKRRLTGDLFSVATTAASAMELRTYGMTDALTERHAALSEEVRAGSVRAAVRGREVRGPLGRGQQLGVAAQHALADPAVVLRQDGAAALVERQELRVGAQQPHDALEAADVGAEAGRAAPRANPRRACSSASPASPGCSCAPTTRRCRRRSRRLTSSTRALSVPLTVQNVSPR